MERVIMMMVKQMQEPGSIASVWTMLESLLCLLVTVNPSLDADATGIDFHVLFPARAMSSCEGLIVTPLSSKFPQCQTQGPADTCYDDHVTFPSPLKSPTATSEDWYAHTGMKPASCKF